MDSLVVDKNNLIQIGEDWMQLLQDPCNFDERLDWLAGTTAIFAGQTSELCEACYQHLLTSPPKKYETTGMPYQIVTYIWAEQAKLFLLLMRDALFEQQKARLRHQDGLVSAAQLQQLWEKTLETLQMALRQLQQKTQRSLQPQDDARRAKRWKHQHNPWPVYKKQIRTIVEQAEKLRRDELILTVIQEVIEDIEVLVEETIGRCFSDLRINNDTIDEVIDLITNSDKKAAHKLASLHETTGKIRSTTYITTFKERLSFLLEPYDIKIEPIVAIEGGLLQERPFAPQKNIIQWFESEIYPLLYEVWEITDQGTTGLRMILLNMTNRLNILQKERPDAIFEDSNTLVKPLHTFQKDLSTLSDSISNLTELINGRVERELMVSCLFVLQKHFLPISLQSSINRRIWNDKNGIVARVQRWALQTRAGFEQQWQQLMNSKRLSISERIASCIQSRQGDPENRHYTNIFLTKGYVGESFMVGREAEFERFERLVNNWKAGFRGSVMLTGDRFSGKTVFGEIVARRFFPNNFHSLTPNTPLTIQGRKMQTTYDLKEALDFVCKHSMTSKPMLWLDDLELWWSNQIPFYKNIHHLMECIDSYSNRIFFVVATNSKAQQQLSNYSHTDRIFQAEINLNILPRIAVQQAIAIRHGATQKKLVDQKGEQLTPKAFNTLVNRIYKNAAGNIGEALLHWAHATYYVDENTVQHRKEAYKTLPSFLNDDSSLILGLLLRHKRANEYLIRHLLGAKPFEVRYATVIRRLLTVGVLRRQLDGFMEIETTIVNDLKQLLNE
jgi:hypothetical protein